MIDWLKSVLRRISAIWRMSIWCLGIKLSTYPWTHLITPIPLPMYMTDRFQQIWMVCTGQQASISTIERESNWDSRPLRFTEVVTKSTEVLLRIPEVVPESTEVPLRTTEVVTESTEVLLRNPKVVIESTEVFWELPRLLLRSRVLKCYWDTMRLLPRALSCYLGYWGCYWGY